jgi:hypothetical protein
VAYIESGEGDPLVFLHGNPTSSFLFRNVVPHLEGMGRIIAPDFIAHGHSSTSPNNAYHFKDNIAYFDAFFEGFDLTSSVTLVIHDLEGGRRVLPGRAIPGTDQGHRLYGSHGVATKLDRHPCRLGRELQTFPKREGTKATTGDNFFTGVILFERGILRNLSKIEKPSIPSLSAGPVRPACPALSCPTIFRSMVSRRRTQPW